MIDKERGEVLFYMSRNTDDSRDAITGEVNHTSLAEDAMWHFNYGDDEFEYLCELALMFN